MEEAVPLKLNLIKQTITSVEIEWNSRKCNVYKLDQFFKHEGWKTIFWGTKTNFRVTGLEENCSFKFMVSALKFDQGKYKILGQSNIFHTCTLADIPSSLAFVRAVKKSQEHLVKSFLEKKISLIDVPGPNGMTPLAIAAEKNYPNMMKILLQAGANVNLGSLLLKRTPLMIAMFAGNTEIGKILLDNRADKYAVDNIGRTFGHYAIDSQNINSVKFVLKHCIHILEYSDSCGWTMLLRAIALRSGTEIISLLLDHKANVNVKDRKKMTCFDYAILTKQNNILKLLHNRLEYDNEIKCS